MVAATKKTEEVDKKPGTSVAAAAESNAVAEKPASALPAALAGMMQEDAGKGISTAREDNVIPMVYILQPLSPQINKNNAEFIERSEPGQVFLKGFVAPLVPGEEGIVFQPCAWRKAWIEWVPRSAGGGFVKDWGPDRPAEAREVKDPDDPQQKRVRIKLGSNDLVETRYYAGIVHVGEQRLRYVIPFKGTGHTIAKTMMTTMGNKLLPGGGAAPSFSNLFRLKTTHKSNKAGEWYQFVPIDMGFVQTPEDYQLGKQCHDAFNSGEIQVEKPSGDLQDDEAESENTGTGDRAAKAGI